MTHAHQHTPCDPCACRLEPFPDGASQCNGDRCPECPPVHPTFGMQTTTVGRELRTRKATQPKLRLAISEPQESR